MTDTPSTTYGTPPRFAWLPTDTLVVDERYQRSITKDGWKRIRKMAAAFAWQKFGVLLVSEGDRIGDHAVFDGQHRLETARLLKLPEVPCIIVDAPDLAAQAVAFKGVNKDRIGVTRVNIFWADHAAGVPQAVAIKELCDACGVVISRVGTGRQKPGHTVALAAIEACMALDEESLRQGLRALVTAQGEAENAFRSATIKALTRLHAMNPGKVEQERLVRILADLDLDDEIDEARIAAKSFRGKTEIALQMRLTRAYNKNLGADRRLEEPRL
ncbi:ParB N-terminal domain-containing protein [Caenispirillum bisanense]|uniref:ParB-like nuclease domain-containing protein n=1 Tax=Caenispirillum bisanense TaxID=414052 RepID=A0A286GYS3_9PROT|nr:DUF6551 family protein [Caenispirillum bisanense]SOE00631.1 ParB-like nuclease domain-containing protein [Caenispirillum bisanense]